ncbi:PucR family transcriptional regulator, partial [Eubacterium callanderi]|nr:PucR family transcriptional regulator [Eubacterium callanderi]
YSPTDVFDVAPRSMTRKISLHQTVELVRTTIDVVEAQIETEMPRGDRQVLRTAIVHYSREVAFAAAEVYARA